MDPKDILITTMWVLEIPFDMFQMIMVFLLYWYLYSSLLDLYQSFMLIAGRCYSEARRGDSRDVEKGWEATGKENWLGM